MKALSITGFLAMIAAVLVLLHGGALFSASPAVLGIQGLAVGLMVWARVAFGRRSFHAAADPTEGGLVKRGPYRFIRHPIYTAVCAFCWAGALAHPSRVALIGGLVVFAGALVRMLTEEWLLLRRLPGYREYARVTKRMVPGVF